MSSPKPTCWTASSRRSRVATWPRSGCASKRCAAAAHPLLEARERPRLWAIYKCWKGATPSLVKGAYYWLDHDLYNQSCDYQELLAPLLEGFGVTFDDYSWVEPRYGPEGVLMAGGDQLLKCTKVTSEACTFQFSRRTIGKLVVPTHALKWLCLGEVPADDGVVVPWEPGNELGAFHRDSPHWNAPNHRWHFQQDNLNGVDARYDPHRKAPHAAELEALQAREAAMPCADLEAAIALLRGPVYRPPLTKQDAPTCRTVRRKMLVPAFREPRKFGVQCAHDQLMCTPSGIQHELWKRYGVDPDDRDEGAYVGYGEFDFEFREDAPFESIYLYHNLGDYKRCRVRAVLERAGFDVEWDDSHTKAIQLTLREADASYDEEDNGYESDESDYDAYSEPGESDDDDDDEEEDDEDVED